MDAPHRPRLRSLAPAVLLAILVVALGALSFTRKVPTFQPLGFTAEAAAGHWRVVEVTAEDSRLEAGDQILLVNGREAGAIGDLSVTLRARPTSDLVVQRGAGLEQVSHSLPPLRIDYPYLILALIGSVYLLIGFYTRWRVRRRPSLIFYLWCVTSALLYLLSPVGPFDFAGKTIFLLDGLARILLAPLTLHLFLVFPRPLGGERRLGRWLPFLYLPAAFLLLVQADLAFFNGAWLLGGSVAAVPMLDQIELYHLVLFSLAAGALLTWRLRRSKHDEPFRQAKWIAVGIAGGYLPFLALYLLPRTLDLSWPTPVTTLAVLPLALVPLTFAWAILRYKLWDIGVLVRDTVSLSLTVLVGVIGFSLANLVISRAVPDDLALARTLVTFVSGVMIAGLLVPTRKGIQGSLERLQYGPGFGKRRALNDFGREILQERSLARLSGSLIEQLRGALELGHASLLLTSQSQLVPVHPQARPAPKLALDDFESDFWGSEMELLSAVEFPSSERTAKQEAFIEGYRYAFPLQVRDTPLGVLLVGYKAEDTPLNSEDIDLVRNLLNQATLAIDNARLLGQVRDQLDEMVRLQQFSQSVIESSPAGIVVVDEAGAVRSANHAFAELVHRPPAELVGLALADLLPLEPLPAPGEGIREFSLTDAEGRERYLQVSAAPLAEEDSEGLRIVVLQDVSERHDMENALKQKERLAALGMLAAGVAHEVNTPITGISSYAQMLISETAEDDPRRELLKKVERQTFRAARIVNNLLEFARDRQRDKAPISIGPVIEECLELLADRFGEHTIELDWQRPVEDVVVLGNDGELQQVFTNLVLNAVDALAAHKPVEGDAGRRLEISLEASEQWVTVAVQDNGPGIAPNELDKIFQPFFSTKLSKGGTGLGLSISFNIVRQHGGELRVVSHPGEGARFLVELPRHQASLGSAGAES